MLDACCKSTGAKNPRIKHGRYTKVAIAEKKSFNLLMQKVNDLLDEMV